MNADLRDNKNKADHGTQKNTTRQSRNPKQVMLLENSCSALWVTPEIPPSPPFSKGGRCEKIDSVLFYVIPAKAGIQCFQGVTNLLDPGFHRGDGGKPIFSQLRGLGGISETRFPTKYSLQNLESLHARSTQIFNELDSKHLGNILLTLTL